MVLEAFDQWYGGEPAVVVRAPGRVNLIGEHTDYNDGFVLPMAIDRAIWVALRPLRRPEVHLLSVGYASRGTFSLLDLQRGPEEPDWLDYPKGVAWALQQAGYSLVGWEGVVAGDIPIGAGLSSSAAFELAIAKAFMVVSGFDWQPVEMAKLARRAENEWVGVNCGIMDQLISAAGVAGQALLIDCRSLALQSVPLPSGTVVLVLDTNTRRGLVDSAYNERRAQCEAAADFFGVPALRDVTMADFEARAQALDPVVRRRAKHILTENARTLAAAEAMRQDDANRLGELMWASHVSLRDDYQVSSHALDIMVDCARHQAGCYGARMTGAGFGGCAVALVAADAASRVAEYARICYYRQTEVAAHIYVCRATAGADVVWRSREAV